MQSREYLEKIAMDISNKNASTDDILKAIKKIDDKALDQPVPLLMNNTLLILAILHQREEVAKELLARGANLFANATDNKIPVVQLMMMDESNMMRSLLHDSLIARLNTLIRDKKSSTDAVINFIEDYNLDINQQKNNEMMPLHYAVIANKADLVSALLKNGANSALVAKNDSDEFLTPIHLAKDSPKIQELFVKDKLQASNQQELSKGIYSSNKIFSTFSKSSKEHNKQAAWDDLSLNVNIKRDEVHYKELNKQFIEACANFKIDIEPPVTDLNHLTKNQLLQLIIEAKNPDPLNATAKESLAAYDRMMNCVREWRPDLNLTQKDTRHICNAGQNIISEHSVPNSIGLHIFNDLKNHGNQIQTLFNKHVNEIASNDALINQAVIDRQSVTHHGKPINLDQALDKKGAFKSTVKIDEARIQIDGQHAGQLSLADKVKIDAILSAAENKVREFYKDSIERFIRTGNTSMTDLNKLISESRSVVEKNLVDSMVKQPAAVPTMRKP